MAPTTPRPQGARFGLGPFRSPLLRASRLISLPPGTEMFQFPGFASRRSVMTVREDGRVSPFGHPGLTGCVRLPPAYRSLPRPSSPLCAQASPTCLRSLDYISCTQAEHARSLFPSRVTFLQLTEWYRSTTGVGERQLSMRFKSHDLPLPLSNSVETPLARRFKTEQSILWMDVRGERLTNAFESRVTLLAVR